MSPAHSFATEKQGTALLHKLSQGKRKRLRNRLQHTAYPHQQNQARKQSRERRREGTRRCASSRARACPSWSPCSSPALRGTPLLGGDCGNQEKALCLREFTPAITLIRSSDGLPSTTQPDTHGLRQVLRTTASVHADKSCPGRVVPSPASSLLHSSPGITIMHSTYLGTGSRWNSEWQAERRGRPGLPHSPEQSTKQFSVTSLPRWQIPEGQGPWPPVQVP